MMLTAVRPDDYPNYSVPTAPLLKSIFSSSSLNSSVRLYQFCTILSSLQSSSHLYDHHIITIVSLSYLYDHHLISTIIILLQSYHYFISTIIISSLRSLSYLFDHHLISTIIISSLQLSYYCNRIISILSTVSLQMILLILSIN